MTATELVPAVAQYKFKGHSVRTIQDSGKPWFIANDVCDILGYVNPRRTIKAHCRPEGVTKRYTPTDSAVQEMTFIDEGNLYRLTIRSKKPEAKEFESWVCDEVLPTIRKTGSYGQAPVDPMTALNDPATMRGLLLNYTEKVIALEHKVELLAPKAAALDLITCADGSLCITNAAKDLHVRPKDLFRFLNINKWIYRRPGGYGWIAYQAKVQQGLLEHKLVTITREDRSTRIAEQVLITSKGISKLAEAFACLEGGTV